MHLTFSIECLSEVGDRAKYDLYCSIADGQVTMVEGALSKSMLENKKFYLLDCGAEVFVWVGRVTQVDDRKAAIQVAEVEI